MTRSREPLVVASALTAVTAAFLTASLQLPATAAFVPIAVAVPTLLLLAGQIVAEVRGRATAHDAAPRDEESDDGRTPGLARREGSTLAWMLMSLGLMWALGILIALPLYLFLHLRLRSHERWSTAATAGAAAWAVLYAGLELLLGVDLHPGALASWWAGA